MRREYSVTDNKLFMAGVQAPLTQANTDKHDENITAAHAGNAKAIQRILTVIKYSKIAQICRVWWDKRLRSFKSI